MNSLTVKRQCELAKWANIVNECNNSGFTVTEWLADHNITKDQFYYWKRKVRDAALDSVMPAFVDVSDFAQVIDEPSYPDISSGIDTTDISQPAASINISNVKLDLYEHTSAEFLKKLIEVAAHVE